MTAIMMTQPKSTKRRRRRGIILTAKGLEKLQEAKAEAEFAENRGNRYTLEALSERTGLAVDTLMKVFGCEIAVDKSTLKDCFKAFDLTLEGDDFEYPEDKIESSATVSSYLADPELPEGQVPLNSKFYLERSPIEADCNAAILQPGALLRLKAPRRMGKSSLMTRTLTHAAQKGCRTVYLSLQLADKSLFQDLDKFLQWFCANVTLDLGLSNQISQYWDDLFGSMISCKLYFEQYLLKNSEQPIVLALDDVDRLFQYPDLADDFFGLLRAWHEEAKHREIWQKLRLIVAHSSEVYIPLNVNQSPFNVGLPVELPEFTPEQVQTLAERYELDWSETSVKQLMGLVGGNPYLIRWALYHIWHQDVTLEQLLTTPLNALNHLYRPHLQRQLWTLQQQHPDLAQAYITVATSDRPVELDLVQAFKLQSLGLVHLQHNQVVPSCRLYATYFRAQLLDK